VFITVALRSIGLAAVIFIGIVAAVGIVAAIMFLTAVLRKLDRAAAISTGIVGAIGIVAAIVSMLAALRDLSIDIPDSYDFGMLLLGILIFWGIAATSYRGTHITVDLVWANLSPRWQRAIDVFATLVLLFVVAVQTYALFDKVMSTYAANIRTFSTHQPTWPFFAIAWLGDASAVLLIVVRTYRLVFEPETMARAVDVARPVE
jgi:TRAP-type transport system small permease protein